MLLQTKTNKYKFTSYFNVEDNFIIFRVYDKDGKIIREDNDNTDNWIFPIFLYAYQWEIK